MKHLPADTDAALAAIATGRPGREATTAHPSCSCTDCACQYDCRGWVCHTARKACVMHGKATP